jgi:MFS family permease
MTSSRYGDSFWCRPWCCLGRCWLWCRASAAPLIPTLSRVDGVSLSTGEWILTIALLTGALATPVMGRLADGPRQRDVILIPLGAVLVGCVLAAVSNGFTVLIVGRALQGLGLGLLPVLMAIAGRNLPLEQARRTIATLSVTAVIGVGLGYPLTGLLAQALDFRAAYWFGAIAVAGAMVLAALVLPARSAGTSRHFDFVGAGLLSLAVAGVSVVLSEGGEWGWASARSLGVIVASAVWHGPRLRVTPTRRRSVPRTCHLGGPGNVLPDLSALRLDHVSDVGALADDGELGHRVWRCITRTSMTSE